VESWKDLAKNEQRNAAICERKVVELEYTTSTLFEKMREMELRINVPSAQVKESSEKVQVDLTGEDSDEGESLYSSVGGPISLEPGPGTMGLVTLSESDLVAGIQEVIDGWVDIPTTD